MATGDSIENQIKLGEMIEVSRPPSWLNRVRSKLTARKIKIEQSIPQPDANPTEDVIDLMGFTQESSVSAFVGVSASQSHDELVRAIKLYPSRTDEIIRRYAEFNQMAAEVFAKAIRGNYSVLIPYANHDYSDPHEWFDLADLDKLIDRWALPAVIFHNPHRAHYMLALSMPEMVDGRWQVLVYDPLTDRPANQSGRTEYYYPLDNWDPNDQNRSLSDQLTENSLNCNPLTYRVIEAGQYDLRLHGDEEAARAVGGAKRVRTQFNDSDCGPLTIFAAAIRTAYKEGDNDFKSTGREILLRDTGVNIRTREEILSEARKNT